MQVQSQAESISLGNSAVYVVSRKAKGRTSGFCVGGCGWVQIKDDGRCPICNAIILKKIRYAEYVKTFEGIILKYSSEFGLLSLAARTEMTIPVPMAGATYFIPIQMFLEFDHIHRNNEGRHKMFFQHIMNTCKSVKC
jgi:rubredoxin